MGQMASSDNRWRGSRLADRRAGGRRRFFLRWMATVVVSMIAAGAVEYAVAVHQLERRSLTEATNSYTADLVGLSDVLVSDRGTADRQEAVHDELEDLSTTHGTRVVTLFDADGRWIDGVGARETNEERGKIRAVVSSGVPSAEAEADEGEAGQDRYEFLLPLQTPL
ncbi:hypothetical protein BH18ACT9_BH18ACT9_00790 [soil metagenome]